MGTDINFVYTDLRYIFSTKICTKQWDSNPRLCKHESSSVLTRELISPLSEKYYLKQKYLFCSLFYFSFHLKNNLFSSKFMSWQAKQMQTDPIVQPIFFPGTKHRMSNWFQSVHLETARLFKHGLAIKTFAKNWVCNKLNPSSKTYFELVSWLVFIFENLFWLNHFSNKLEQVLEHCCKQAVLLV